jgi:hypothetical protein
MEATEKRRCKNQKAIMRISKSLTRSREARRNWWELLCKSQVKRKDVRRGHWGTKTREAEKNTTKCESLPKRRVREPEVRANRDQNQVPCTKVDAKEVTEGEEVIESESKGEYRAFGSRPNASNLFSVESLRGGTNRKELFAVSFSARMGF